jgi:succinoglycan biosynthesis transport protein ExoP
LPQYELSLRDYLRIVRKRKITIILTFLFATFLSFLYSSRQIPTYEAKTTIKIEERKTIAGLLTEEIISSPGDPMTITARMISGIPVLKKAALRLGMIDENTSLEKAEEVAGELQGSISAAPIINTNIIEITATSEDPKKAMDLANAVAEAYVEESHLEKNKAARTVRVFIEGQLSSLEKRSNDAEERLKILRSEVKDIQISPTIQNKLTELQFELATLSQRYTDKHPAVKKVNGQIETLESQLKGFSGQELEYVRLTREVDVNKKLYEMLREKLEEARITEAQRVSDVSVVDPAVFPGGPVGTQKEMGVMIGALLGIIMGVALAFVRESLDTSVGTIDDVENITKLPVLGVVPSVPTRPKEEKNIWVKLKRRFLPEQKSEKEEAYIRLIVHHEPSSSIAEACRNIRTNLKLNESKKTVLITSAGPREGKTTVLINLGLTVAQTGARTLLVSTDLRRPALDKTFGIPREPGINEIIAGRVTLEDALRNISDIMLGEIKLKEIIKSPGMENVWILTGGHIPLNPAEILESSEMENLIKELRSRFDVVFFDSPPVLPVTDASLLASKVDSVILCYEVGRTSRDALLRAKVQLESVGAKISGIILNHTALQSETVYPYYYHYKYRYYEKEKEGKPGEASKG